MKKNEVVKEVLTAIEKQSWNSVEEKLTDDFTFSGAVPTPIGKKEWVGVHRAIGGGLPDLRFNLHDVNEQGEKVKAKVRITGTHTGILNAPIPGAKTYPSTGAKIQLPEEEVEVTFRGEKISNFYVKPVAHGGVNGLIEKIEEAQKEHVM